jgi:4-hydroxy-L-threonine phosphate dehydrogenase PdxA
MLKGDLRLAASTDSPLIAITMGDPAGIGPELVAKVLASYPTSNLAARVLVVGDPVVMREAANLVGADLRFRPVEDPSEAAFSWPQIDVLCPEGVRVGRFSWGRVDAEMGKAAALCLEAAARLAMAGVISGITSAPLNKEAFHRAGYNYRDELAFLAELTGSPEPFIGGVVDQTWTITVTEHIPFKDILGEIRKERVLARIALLDAALRRAGFAHPRIGVAALNVHAGDGGLFGREEIDEIGPAIEEARRRAIDVQGPIAADSIFVSAFSGTYDGVVCMYHDQANIARKLQTRSKGATLFLGLPVMCATTAHGTAFDIAGKGIADAGGLETALRWTCRFAASGGPGTSSTTE